MVVSGKDALGKILDAVSTVVDSVKVTLGPDGRNVILGKEFDTFITNDGVTIAKFIRDISKGSKKSVSHVFVQSSLETDASVGDGTTTSIVIAGSLIRGFAKAMDNILLNPVVVRKEIESTVAFVLDELSKVKHDKFTLYDVAFIASGDEEIAKLASEVVSKVGIDGTVLIEESDSHETRYEHEQGITIDRGLVSSYLLDGDATEITDCNVLIYDGTLSSSRTIESILKACARDNKGVLIVADDYTPEFTREIVMLKESGAVKPVLIKSPGFGKNRDELLKDISSISGATIVIDGNATIEHLGCLKKVRSDLRSSNLIGGDAKQRVKELKALKPKTEYEKKRIKERISQLENGIITIYVGGDTEVEQRDRKYRIEDAVYSCKSTSEGVVPGGGVALYNIASSIKEDTDGAKIVASAISEPYKQICENSGVSNPKYDDTVVDPYKVTVCALKNALSVAKTIITTEVLAVEDKKKNDFRTEM